MDPANTQGWFLQLLGWLFSLSELMALGFHQSPCSGPCLSVGTLPTTWDALLGDHNPSMQWHRCGLMRDGTGTKPFYSMLLRLPISKNLWLLTLPTESLLKWLTQAKLGLARHEMESITLTRTESLHHDLCECVLELCKCSKNSGC